MTTITIKQVSWQQQQTDLHALRHQVFVIEQQVPPHLEWEGDEENAYHWLAYNEQQQPLGCARLLKSGAIGRMAIVQNARGQNIGLRLLQAAIDFAQQQLGFNEVFLSAQTHALGFYQKAGFVAVGEEYQEAGINHIKMRKQLSSQPQLGVSAGKMFVPHHKDCVLCMVQQCRRQLRILDYALNPAVYDHKPLLDAVSALARRHRNSQVKLLLVNSQPVIKRGHGLLKLQRRLPSAIAIKQLNDDTGVSENLVLADDCGTIAQSLLNPETIWADFNNKPVAQTKIDHFEILWGQANANNDFRLLDL